MHTLSENTIPTEAKPGVIRAVKHAAAAAAAPATGPKTKRAKTTKAALLATLESMPTPRDGDCVWHYVQEQLQEVRALLYGAALGLAAWIVDGSGGLHAIPRCVHVHAICDAVMMLQVITACSSSLSCCRRPRSCG